jgi:hypothetical protein
MLSTVVVEGFVHDAHVCSEKTLSSISLAFFLFPYVESFSLLQTPEDLCDHQ